MRCSSNQWNCCIVLVDGDGFAVLVVQSDQRSSWDGDVWKCDYIVLMQCREIIEVKSVKSSFLVAK